MRNALQRALASVGETKARSDDEVLHGARYQHLTRVGGGLYASGDVHADPAQVIADQLAFPRVHPDSQLAAQCLGSGASQRHAGADRARGAVKGGEHTVARRLHDAASIATHFSLDESVVALENIPPSAIAQRSGALGRAHDIGEQDSCERPIDRPVHEVARQESLDLIEQGVLVAGAEEMVTACKLDHPRIRDSSCDPAREDGRDDSITFAAEDQRRRPDTRQQRTDIGMQIHLPERLGTAWAEA